MENIFDGLEASWKKVLKDELAKPYIQELSNFVLQERQKKMAIYPPEELVFNAFAKTKFDDVTVVIMGQDPYHGKNQADGLSFSVPPGIKIPPSLKNIFKELKSDLNLEFSDSGYLSPWAEQGVFLLNATLTVSEKNPMSHHGRGWERFTDAVIYKLIERKDPVIFVLWGASAQKKKAMIKDNSIHKILTAPHPSPFSVHKGFFGCRHFSKINELLIEIGKEKIEWII